MQLEAITSKQKRIFDKLKNFPEYYLAGGTALALQIGHRISIDFDLFSKGDIPSGLLKKIKRTFKGMKVETIVDLSEQLSVKINGARIDFVKYNFPLILKPIELEDVKILRIPEIAIMKAFTLSHRGALKDYVDLYFILKDKHMTLRQIEKMAERKYKDEFYFRLFLEQLVYLKDLKDEKIEFLREKVTREEIEKFFENEVKKIKI